MSSVRENDQDEQQPRMSRLLWILLTIFVLSLVILIASVVLSLIMPDFNLTPAAIDSVSGYYGPGSVAAWLVLAFSNSEFTFLLKFITRPIRGKSLFIFEDLFDLKVDAAIIGTVAYPLVAFVDLVLQIITSSKSSEGPSMQESIHAQLSIVHLSSAISIVALWAHSLYMVMYYFIKDIEDLALLKPRLMMRRRRTRLAMWTTIFMASQIFMSLLGFEFRVGIVRNLKHYSSLLTVIVLSQTVLIPDGDAKGGSSKIAWAFFLLVFLVLIPWVNLQVGEEYGIRFPWPQTTAKLSDLDQAAALGVSLCTTGASLAKWIARKVETRKKSDADADDDTTGD